MCGSPGPDPDNAVRPYRPEAVLRSVSALPLLARPGRTRGDRRPGAAMRPDAPITSLSAISNEGSRIAARPRTGWSISDVRDEAPDPPTDASAVQPWEPAHGRSRRRRRRGAERAHPRCVSEHHSRQRTHRPSVGRLRGERGTGAPAPETRHNADDRGGAVVGGRRPGPSSGRQFAVGRSELADQAARRSSSSRPVTIQRRDRCW